MNKTDWSREEKSFFSWCPSKSLLAAHRAYAECGRSHYKRPKRILAILRHRFWSVISGCEIPLKTHIGGGLLLPHPNGVVISRYAVIGTNCTISQQVTIGAIDSDPMNNPSIGSGVYIGSGAKILGRVHIGDGARIGANTVVLKNVPPNTTAVGVPSHQNLTKKASNE